MNAPQKFRSAFNGFNREDVVHYIEFTNSRHDSEVNQLKEQIEFYRNELAMQGVAVQQAEKERSAELEQKYADLAQTCAKLEAENEALRRQLQEASQNQSSADEELEAYRRAERTERLAKNRVSQMYAQANAAIADTSANLDVAAENLGAVAQATLEQVQALQAAVIGSKQIITDAAVALGAIRPGTEEEEE